MKSFICRGCSNHVISTGRSSVDIGASANLEVVDKFCYLGDMLSVDGDADAAVEARIRIGWNILRQSVPLLTNWLGEGGCIADVCEVVCYNGSETWPVRKENKVALERAEIRMLRWKRVPSNELRERLAIDDIILILQQNRLRWYGHVLQKEDADWVKKSMEYEVEGSGPRSRPKRTWREVVHKDYLALNLNREDAMGRSRWRNLIKIGWW